MKLILYSSFLLSVLFACTPKSQDQQELEVTWYIPVRYSDTLDELPWKLLDAIDERKIKTYDSTLRELSREEVESRITSDMRSIISLTKEECDIMLANGDSSFGAGLQPKQTPQQLAAIYANGKNIDSLLITKHALPFETKVCQLELVEKVRLDTSLRKQMGEMQYIRLIVPKEYTKSGKNEILCQVKYEDFKTLGMPEEEIIDNHAFQIIAEYGNLTIDDGNKIQRLSSIVNYKLQAPPVEQIRHSIFKYFGKNIWAVSTVDDTSKDVPMELVE